MLLVCLAANRQIQAIPGLFRSASAPAPVVSPGCCFGSCKVCKSSRKNVGPLWPGDLTRGWHLRGRFRAFWGSKRRPGAGAPGGGGVRGLPVTRVGCSAPVSTGRFGSGEGNVPRVRGRTRPRLAVCVPGIPRRMLTTRFTPKCPEIAPTMPGNCQVSWPLQGVHSPPDVAPWLPRHASTLRLTPFGNGADRKSVV